MRRPTWSKGAHPAEDDCDFAATAMRIVDQQRSVRQSVRLGRVLPVTTVGSFGR
jgi:hypothetical protein